MLILKLEQRKVFCGLQFKSDGLESLKSRWTEDINHFKTGTIFVLSWYRFAARVPLGCRLAVSIKWELGSITVTSSVGQTTSQEFWSLRVRNYSHPSKWWRSFCDIEHGYPDSSFCLLTAAWVVGKMLNACVLPSGLDCLWRGGLDR